MEYDGFSRSSDGKIICDNCSKTWCDHVSAYLNAGNDSFVLWDRALNDGDGYGEKISVPVVPTCNVWLTCRLIYSEKLHAFKVIIDPVDSGDEEFLGFIHASEGRYVIRSMFIDWFEANKIKGPSIFRCRASTHRFQQEKEWKRKMQLHRWMLHEYIVVWSTGFCSMCNVLAADFGDTVPDGPPKADIWGKH